uniref:FAD dependent oxidoreductase n=1 Tax=Candidatus Kentrum sp. UNK TaxID=2126344 RepID=A0A451B4W7_9GAMM|nr:MAG: FAD dependent oxidoreductase [Candidatus Kentron sp. UNK]VFK73330.1 MAG: FAD dependent oxidoreductase [Candidatus Kentron sp. UNK]
MSEPPYKLIVVGAGAGGLACALAAADADVSVLLLEKSARLGGTITQSLLHTIGGLYDDAGEYLNPGLPVELEQRLLRSCSRAGKRKMGRVWVLNVAPTAYEDVIESWVADKPAITVLRQATITRLEATAKRITRVEVTRDKSVIPLTVGAVVDATGAAEITRMLDEKKVLLGNALAGLIFQIRGVEKDALKFPKNVVTRRAVQAAVEQDALPDIFNGAWFDTGVWEDEAYIKLNLSPQTYTPRLAMTWQAAIADLLPQLPGFTGAHITRRGELGIRDGGRIRGEYNLTLADIKNNPPVSESAGRCAWPIEYWHPQTGVTLDYLPAGHTYTIPLPALRVAGMDNLWAVGKCLSAEPLAQASARVAGACWAMGEAVGRVLSQRSNMS